MTVPLLADGRTAPFYYILKTDFLKAREVGPFAWAIYNCLCYHANQSQIAFPSYQTIADECGIGKGTVSRHVDSLVRAGLVTFTDETTGLGFNRRTYRIARSTGDTGVPLKGGPCSTEGGALFQKRDEPVPETAHNKIQYNKKKEQKSGYRERSASRKTRCPETITITDAMRDFARDNRIDLDSEWEKCRDHHQFRGTLGVDWQRGFWTWLRKAVQFNGSQDSGGGTVVVGPEEFERIMAEKCKTR